MTTQMPRGRALFLYLFASLQWNAFSGCAQGFEIKRHGQLLPTIPPIISITDAPKQSIDIAFCAATESFEIEKRLERAGMIARLPEAYQIGGHEFQWRIGSEVGTTYWNRVDAGGSRQQVTLYFPALDLLIVLHATSIRSGWSNSTITRSGDDTSVRSQGSVKLSSDLSLIFLDADTGEMLQVRYWSRIDERENAHESNSPLNRNIWVASIERATAECLASPPVPPNAKR